MVTAYSPILKLALPVQGELSGTWGDVVNDNITSMVEQAIAGRAVIDTWTTDSHTLTTANGTTSESRCAMLELTDTGTALTGAGTVICPTASKIYIVKNNAGQNITVKTVSGTGILVPNGRTTFLFCDGTNVVEAMTHTTSLQLGTSTVVTAVLDEDNMASDSATSLATQQSIKAYVDAQVGANNELSEVLANGNTSGANDIIVDNGQKITVNTIEETTAAAGVTIDSVLLKDDGVNATNLEVTNIKANDGTAAATIANSTGVITVPSAVLTTADINGGTADDVVIGGTTPAAATVTTATANTSLNIAGTVTVTSILDEDNMASDDPAGLATQQSIKAYVDAQVGANNELSEVLANGNTTGGTDIAVSAGDDITFTNTSKAIFGTGSSLEIYGDGSNSYIKDDGTGDLKIQGANVRLENPSGVRYFQGSSGISYLYNSGDIKLTTTATGIDVTGTVQGDKLVIDTPSSGAAFEVNLLDNSSDNFVVQQGSNKYVNITTVNTAEKIILGNETTIPELGINFDSPNTFGSGFVGIQTGGTTGTVFSAKSRNYIGSNIYNDGSWKYVGNGLYAPMAVWDANSGDTVFYTTASGLTDDAITFIPAMQIESGSAGMVFNENGADRDFRVESDANANALFVDAGLSRVGINLGTPGAALDVLASGSDAHTARFKFGDSNGGYVSFYNNTASAYAGYIGSAYHLVSTSLAANDFAVRSDGTNLVFATAGSSERLRLSGSSTVFNESGGDTDFRVESFSNANMLFVDAANNEVGIGTSSPDATMHVYGSLTVGKAGVSENFDLKMWPSTAGRSTMGLSNKDNYIALMSGDPLSTELFTVTTGGRGVFVGGLTVNENSEASEDFRVESDSKTHMLFVDASSNKVGIGASSPQTILEILDSSPILRLEDSAVGSKRIEIGVGSDSVAFVNAPQSAQTLKNSITGTESLTQYHNTSGVVVNESGADRDFRVESDSNAYALYMDAGASKVSINTASSSNGILNVYSPTTYGKIFMSDSTLGYGYGAFIQGYGVSGSGGYFQLGSVDANTQTVAMQVNQQATSINFLTRDGASGTSASRLILDQIGGSGAVFNETGQNYDFRVESDSSTHALFVDGGNNRVGVLASAPRVPLEVGSLGTAVGMSETQIALAAFNGSHSAGLTFFDDNGEANAQQFYFDPGTCTLKLLTTTNGGTNKYNRMEIQGNAAGGEVSFNQDGQNHDFRVESDSNSNMFIVDAGNNRVKVGGNAISSGMVSIQKDVNEDTDIGNTPSLVFRNRSLASGSDNIGGGIFFDTFRDVQDPCIAAGIWFNKQPTGGVANHADIIFGTSVQYGNNTDAPTERMRITDGGKILAGQSTLMPTFHASSTVQLSSASQALSCTSTGSGAQSPVAVWRQNAAGFLLYFTYGVNNTKVGDISANSTSTSYNTSSDYRLKTDAQPMTGASARVQALKPVNFEWIADGTRVDGFLAHEAQEVVPEAVTGTKDAVDADGNPEYQGIDQSKLVPLLTAALQEALTKIETLEARITALENA